MEDPATPKLNGDETEVEALGADVTGAAELTGAPKEKPPLLLLAGAADGLAVPKPEGALSIMSLRPALPPKALPLDAGCPNENGLGASCCTGFGKRPPDSPELGAGDASFDEASPLLGCDAVAPKLKAGVGTFLLESPPSAGLGGCPKPNAALGVAAGAADTAGLPLSDAGAPNVKGEG